MILDRLRRKKKVESTGIARSDFLNIRPVRNPAVEVEKDEDGKITLVLKLEKPKEEKKEPEEEKKKEEEPEKEKPSRRPRRKGIFSSTTPPQRQKKFHLDTIGSIVWEMCDGQKTVKELAQQMRDKYKMLPSEAEISLNSYFNNLANRGLIAFLVPDDVASRLSKQKEAKKEEQKKQSTKQ